MARPKSGLVDPRTNQKVAEQPFAPIPSLPGTFGKQPEDKKKKKRTGGFGVK